MDFINIIICNVIKKFDRFDPSFNRIVPTAGVEVKNLSWGVHPTYWGDHGDEGELDVIAPLQTKTITYNLICDPQDHEAMVEAIAGEFAKVDLYKLLSVEVIRTPSIKWSARKGQAVTRKGSTTLTITWSEDSRLAG